MKIHNSTEPHKLEDSKRFYPPFTIMDTCPQCFETVKNCGPDIDYLGYPTVNKPMTVTFYCSACDDNGKPCEWPSKPFIIRITAELVGTEIPS